MWCDGEGGDTDTNICALLDFDPPNRTLWSWVLDGSQHQGDTSVEFTVESVASGIKVINTHTGDRDPETIEKFKGRWPYKRKPPTMVALPRKCRIQGTECLNAFRPRLLHAIGTKRQRKRY